MRAILQAAGLDTVRLDMIKPVVDTCRECRVWERPGNSTMPSVSLPTRFNQECECDLLFYKRHIAFHIMDRAIRLADGCEIPNKERDTLLEAYTTAWVQRQGPAQVLYSDAEGGFHNDTAKSALQRLGTELRIRAPGQHAVHIEARNAILRHTLHVMEEDLKRHDITISFPRLLGEAIFVTNSFTFYNGVSPYNAYTGRQPPFLPDLETLDESGPGESSDHERERRVRLAAIEAITQSTAVAKINRALKTKTTIDGARLYKEGDLIDYYRPTNTKDEHGGWNGPARVLKNDPDRGSLQVQVGGKTVVIHYPNARLTLYLEVLLARETSVTSGAMRTIIDYISSLPSGKTPVTYGYTQHNNQLRPATTNTTSPKIYMALQYLLKTFFQLSSVVTVRLGKGVHTTTKCPYASGSTLIYYENDTEPDFKLYETTDTALDIINITNCAHVRIIQCLTTTNEGTHDDILNDPGVLGNEHPDPDDEQDDVPIMSEVSSGRLPTIHEDDEENNDDALVLESFYAELMKDETLVESDMPEEPDSYPICMADIECVEFSYHEPDDDDFDEAFLTYRDFDERGNSLSQSTLQIAIADIDSEVVDAIEPEADDQGKYFEICFTTDMAKTILSETQLENMESDDVATLRVYISAAAKRAVVVKEDDLLTKNDLLQHQRDVAAATIAELKIWISNKCFDIQDLSKAKNVMTSRYVAKWKFVKNAVTGVSERTIRMRLVLRGFMDTEAFSIDTFSGTARRTSQRILASESACNPSWELASLDIDKAFLQGLTYSELAKATGEQERLVCFTLPPGSAALLRTLPGFAGFDESRHCLRCLKPGTGTKDAPRAFSLKLRNVTQNSGLCSTSYDSEFELGNELLTAKHVDDINMSGNKDQISRYVSCVEKTFGKCKLNTGTFTNCGVRYSKTSKGVEMDQDEYVKTLRPIVHPELTGAPAEKPATKIIADQFVSLRGALAYTTLTQAWIQVYIVALQRVQHPTNLDVRRLNAVTRKLQASPKHLIYPTMKCSSSVDILTDSGYRRMTGEDDDVKGYGMRGLTMLRRGNAPSGDPVVHLVESICKSHRLQVRSSYAAEALAAAHGLDDVYPTLVTLHEIKKGILTPNQLKRVRERGGLCLKTSLTTDAESVYKSLTSRDLKIPTEKTLLGHVAWIRELLSLGILTNVQWCDTRDMAADGHTKGSIDRDLLLKLMIGQQKYLYDIKSHTPHRATSSSS